MSRTRHPRPEVGVAAAFVAPEPRRPVVAPELVERRADRDTLQPVLALDLVDDDFDLHLGKDQPLRATFLEALRLAFPQRGSVDRGIVFGLGTVGLVLLLATLPFTVALALVVLIKVAIAATTLRGKQ